MWLEGLHFCEVHHSVVQQGWWIVKGQNASATALSWFASDTVDNVEREIYNLWQKCHSFQRFSRHSSKLYQVFFIVSN